MSHPTVSAPASAGPTGLIDTLQTGFNTVNRHLWLLLLPLAVDVHLWLGPQLTIGAAVSDWASGRAEGSVADTIERVFGEGDRTVLIPSEQLRRYNVFWLLAVPLLGVPSFRAGVAGSGAAIAVDSVPALAVAAGCILILGVSLAVFYYGLLAQVVRSGRAALSSFAREFGGLWVRAVALIVLSAAVGFLIAVPIVALLAVAQGAAPALLVLASLVLGIVVWLGLHLFFTTDALFVGLVGPITAVQRSVAIVRSSFWESIVFVGLLVVITSGFPIILHELERNLQTTGMVLAIVGHIYISASVSAASMTYYRERFERLQPKVTR